MTLAALAMATTLHGAAAAQSQSPQRVPEDATEIRLSFAPVVRKIVPSVVNVFADRAVRGTTLSPFSGDPFFRRFFDNQPSPPRRMQSSLGSGVIVSTAGLVVTNNHVIAGADEIRIALSDRREFPAEVVLRDERSDLAVLRIESAGAGFPAAELGDSDGLAVGDLVLAVGNPFGVGQTVTQGIVSALARNQVGVTDYQFFIQTDAAINPGNSGGALVDTAGRVIGINTAIFSRDGGSNGIGFAIPANMVRLIVGAAENGGVVRRPWIGANFQSVNADIAEGLGLDRPRGALVTSIVEGGPADEAGLRTGDLVTAVDGIAVDDPDAFGYRFVTQGLGGSVPIEVERGGRTLTLDVALRQAPESVPRDTRRLTGNSPLEGATVVNLSPAVAEELQLPAGRRGVAIDAVETASSAGSLGFRRGDIVVEVNGAAVTDTASLAAVLAIPTPVWRMVIDRGGRQLSLAVRS